MGSRVGSRVVHTAVALLAALTLIQVPAVHAATSIPGGMLCTPVVHSWVGRAAVDPGQSFHTGSFVPAQTGVQLAVGAYDVSTDVPAPGALTLLIGDTPVAGGTAVVGGEISVTNIGAESVVVTRVEISVDECVQVEVAGPLPSVLAVPTTPIDLPATGSTTLAPLAAAVLALGVGGALIVVRHRRPGVTGSGRGR